MPNVVVSDRQQTKVVIGESIPSYEKVAGSVYRKEATEVKKRLNKIEGELYLLKYNDAGMEATITPTIVGAQVRMALDIHLTNFSFSADSPPEGNFQISKHSISTTLMARDGETAFYREVGQVTESEKERREFVFVLVRPKLVSLEQLRALVAPNAKE